MKQIQTQIDIAAPIEEVWQVFTDINHYKEWNPFLINMQGELTEGAQITATARLSKDKVKVGTPKVLKIVEGQKAVLIAKKGILFKGEHYFTFESLSDSSTRMIHGEKFSGLLPFLLWNKLEPAFTKAFIAMNQAMKERVEGRK